MLSQEQINTILKYILFFCAIYILTCFFDKILVYYWLFIVFFLAITCKLAFYSDAATLANVSWYYIGLCVLCIFADKIKGENFSPIFKGILEILSMIGKVIKSIFTNSLITYMFLFMTVSTVYASLISDGSSNKIILGWVMGIVLGTMVWIFLS